MSKQKNQPGSKDSLHLTIGITGASGAIYARHLIQELLRSIPGESFLVVSPPGLRVFNQEFQTGLQNVRELLNFCSREIDRPLHTFNLRDYQDVGAQPASGSTPSDGMVIIPCSMKTLSTVALGSSTNLIERAADVTLKERRPLIVVPRETPYNLIHLRNMTALTEAGGIVLPASPAFYQRPQTIDDLGRFIAGRILALFGVSRNLYPAWGED